MSNKKCILCDEYFEQKHKSQRFCNRSCAAIYTNTKRAEKGWRHSEESKQQMREDALTNPTGWAANPINNYIRKKDPNKWVNNICKECNIEFWFWKSQKKIYCSNKCYHKNAGGFNPGSTKKTKSIYKNYQMDSSSERTFAILLDKHDIEWSKNATIYFEFINSNGETRKYYPDFYLLAYDLWVEIKAEYYLREDDDLRWASVPNHEVIWHDNIRLPKYIGGSDGT